MSLGDGVADKGDSCRLGVSLFCAVNLVKALYADAETVRIGDGGNLVFAFVCFNLSSIENCAALKCTARNFYGVVTSELLIVACLGIACANCAAVKRTARDFDGDITVSRIIFSVMRLW